MEKIPATKIEVVRLVRRTPEARSYVAAFWHGAKDYEFQKTRSCVGTADATRRMNQAIDWLIEKGVFPTDKHYPMPTLDEIDFGYPLDGMGPDNPHFFSHVNLGRLDPPQFRLIVRAKEGVLEKFCVCGESTGRFYEVGGTGWSIETSNPLILSVTKIERTLAIGS